MKVRFVNLNRKIIILKAEEEGIIKFNYYYRCMKSLYSMVTSLDENLGKKLHDEGYKVDSKIFKLFTFGISCNESKSSNEGFIVKSGEKIKLTISGEEKILNIILKSIIKNKYIVIENIKFSMVDVKEDNKVRFNKIMLYRVQTPVVESIYDVKEKRVKFLNVFQNEFYNALAQNLMRKYEIIYGKKYKGDLFFDIEDIVKVKKRYIKDVKGKGFLIGYNNFEIFIEANEDMQKVVYYTSLGQNNSMGMGLLKYITGRRCV